MPRKGTREDAAKRRLDRKYEAHQAKYGMTATVEPKFKTCDFCGRLVMVNNYEDGKSRTPRWRKTKMVICPWCNPATYTGTVTKPILYKTIMSRVLVEKLAAKNFCFKDPEFADERFAEGCNCLGCGARKIVAIKEERLEV